jgi:FAD/FMN-containing dehydrogenase
MNMPIPGPFKYFENFGHSLKSASYHLTPKSAEELLVSLNLAKKESLTITIRGAGRSYNDAALNGGGIILDMQGMKRILAWEADTGIITLEPGVTLQELWQKVLPDGWWPPVVSGTMTTTLGGCLAANIHGKNNYKAGTIGEHVLQFTALLPTGAEMTCSPSKNGDLFHAMIGGFGLLGIFTSITLQMKKMYSGFLQVQAWQVPNLATHLKVLEEAAPMHSYVVGWMDTTATDRGMGRGQLHSADYLAEDEDTCPEKTLQVAYQSLPKTFFGIFPKSLISHFMVPFMNTPGAWLINTVKYLAAGKTRTYLQPHAAYHFLLDYVSNWERSYGQLVQYQSFLPVDSAQAAWTEMLALSHKQGLPAYLGVTKRHRPDNFLLTHALDGFSLALDFKAAPSRREKIRNLFQEFDRIVLGAGGRFYFAKNSETNAETTRRFLGDETISKFRKLKRRCDPDGILESDLSRRILPEEISAE